MKVIIVLGCMPQKKKSIAILPGSFDPVTLGHADIVRRSVKIFDQVVVSVLAHPQKNTLFSVDERVALLKKEFADLGNAVLVTSFSGLLVEYARKVGAQVVIRGLRAVSDYDYETQMALMNRRLAPELETFFLVSREENSYISSSLIKQVVAMGARVDKFVSEHVERALTKKLSSSRARAYHSTRKKGR